MVRNRIPTLASLLRDDIPTLASLPTLTPPLAGLLRDGVVRDDNGGGIR